ncbi:histidine kinase [Paenibacillus sp. NPDC058071]|uniref:sensor histidine kinase n=1 Tax=Paenibacillus sp. NPDC058071 TaxID=3346326 RepID=UPI0036DD3CBE
MGLSSMSWRKKLITTALLCLFIPSMLTLLITGLNTRAELKEKAVAKAEQSLEVADLYVSNLVSDMLKASNTVQYDSEMMTAMRTAWSGFRKSPEGKLDFFAYKPVAEKLDQLPFFGGKTYVTILLPGGLYFTNYSTYRNDLKYMYSELWVDQMEKEPLNTTLWLGTQPNYVKADAADHPKVVTVVRSFQLFANTGKAYIVLSKPEEQFHEIFGKYASDQTMLLLDEKGTIISHTDPRAIGGSLISSLELAPAEGKGEAFSANLSDYIRVEHPLSIGSWSIVSLTPYKEAAGNINGFLNDLIMLQVLFFVLFSVVLFYLLRQLTLPIVQLAKIAERVDAGNLDARSKFRGADEIGRLGLSFDRMLDRIKEMIHQIKREQDRKRMAELELLQAQINPHFLFNTLNSIRLRVLMKGEKEIAEIVGSLSTLLRMTINRNNEFISLYEEVGTVKEYMRLMNFRHVENIRFTTNLASDTLLAAVPRFTLQPLIENAYIHGLRHKEGSIEVHSWKQGHLLLISIQDDGIGMNEEQKVAVMERLNDRTEEAEAPAEAAGGGTGERDQVSGIGLKNVHERLRMIYGDAYGIEIDAAYTAGLKLLLRLPITLRQEEEEDAYRIAGR